MTTTPSAPGEGAITLSREDADTLYMAFGGEDGYESLSWMLDQVWPESFWVPVHSALLRIVEQCRNISTAAAPRPAEEADGRHQPTEEAIESALDFGRRQLAFAAKERERRQKQTRSSRRVNGHAI